MTEKFETKQETTLRDFLNVVFRRIKLIGVIVVLSAVIVVVLNERQPRVYESNARILIRRGEQGDAFRGTTRYLGWAEEVSSHVQMILSDDVFAAAKEMFSDSLRARGLPEGLKFNPGAVRADVIGESNVFVIRYTDINPAVSRLGCEAMLVSFEEYYRASQGPPVLSDFFVSELTDVRSELDHLRGRREKFLSDEKFFGMQETSKYLLGRIGNAEVSLVKFNGEVASQAIRVANLDDLRKKTGAELEEGLAFSVSRHVLQSGIVQKIKLSLQDLNIHREDLRRLYTDEHPEVVAVNKQIGDLHADLKRQVDNAYQVERIEFEELEAQREAVVKDLVSARKELDMVPDRERKLTEIDAMIAKGERKHELLLNRKGESEIAAVSQPSWEVTILSHAGVAFSKKTRDYVRLALGPLLSMIIALGVAFFLESVDHSVKNSAEAEEYLEIPVLATVSEFKERKERKQRKSA